MKLVLESGPPPVVAEISIAFPPGRRRLRVPPVLVVFAYLSPRTEACGALYTRDVGVFADEGPDRRDLVKLDCRLKLCCRLVKLDLRSVDGVLSVSVIPGSKFIVFQ